MISRLPEIGEESLEKNPLLKDDNLPEFNTITIEKCTAVIGKQTVDFEEKMKSLEKVVDSKLNIKLKIKYHLLSINNKRYFILIIYNYI